MTADVQFAIVDPIARDRSEPAPPDKPLVNPVSGLANDYLNLFNELVMMLEQLPQMPELIDDLLAWRPETYRDYFERSQLSGRLNALAAYERLDPIFRRRFEAYVAELDTIAVASVAAVRLHYRHGAPQDLSRVAGTCARAGEKMRAILTRCSRLVNYGKYGDE
ncbi:hypothetical protein [Methylosinus sp. Sm6]|uniref:hypothetical protein n=1 Tax=Methylosinus sp. Sm6 TaxID=2866948 RepID=UPI001C991D2C|nr:hypothetical protein [Methylosinus sp. Sm6]MBY6241597.1 hypothetical protein [Methylosinus sp. Sm6]